MTTKAQKAEKKIIGTAYDEPKNLTKKYAKKDIPLLFLGETGSGKELFANLYMEESKRTGNIRTINCAAISGTVLDSEIFGHEKGAFTGAIKKRDGLLQTCNNGILLLDELGSSSKEFQAAILRVAEMNSFKPLGSDKEITDCDTLVIAATSSLSTIREDLKYRFNILPIPPLQKFDIPAILENNFGKSINRITLEMLMNRDYPGNVRQLLKVATFFDVEKGQSVFSKKRADTKRPLNTFDYYRFRDEFMLWQTFIQPCLDKNNIRTLRYQYRSQFSVDPKFQKDYCNSERPDTLKYLVENMVNYRYTHPGFNEEGLFSELDYCQKAGAQQLIFDTIKSVISEKRYADKNCMPDLAPLLKIKSPKKARQEFEKHYYGYHLEKNNLDRKKTAAELDLNLNTLKSALNRLNLKAK